MIKYFLVLLAFLLPTNALAQHAFCADRQQIIDKLKERYEEVPRYTAIATPAAILEILISPSGTYTVIVTSPGSPTCLVASGKHWRKVRPYNKDIGT